MKKIIYVCFFCLITISSCKKNDVYNERFDISKTTATSFQNKNRSIRPIILGEQKENPFSLENMTIALDTLRKIVDEDSNSAFKVKAVDEIELKATDIYVRFLPKDSLEYKQLKSDTTLILFDFPLDYEIVQNGDFYKDTTVNTQFTWYYATVKPGYQPPSDIEYEVIEELFIPENSEYYSEEPVESSDAQYVKSESETTDDNILKALYAISFKLTGNEKDLTTNDDNATTNINATSNSSIRKVRIENCTRYTIKFLWWTKSWVSCDPYYYPNGYIKVNTPYGNVGLKGVKVRMWRWFIAAETRTNANGYYLLLF